jgi:hypothetical protein
MHVSIVPRARTYLFITPWCPGCPGWFLYHRIFRQGGAFRESVLLEYQQVVISSSIPLSSEHPSLPSLFFIFRSSVDQQNTAAAAEAAATAAAAPHYNPSRVHRALVSHARCKSGDTAAIRPEGDTNDFNSSARKTDRPQSKSRLKVLIASR